MGTKYIPFEKYRDDNCSDCIRAPICEQTEEAMILCRLCAFFKGIDDKLGLPRKEKEALNGIPGMEKD